MPYSQKQWQDRIKDAQGNIIQEGTPFSAGNMNRMEQGIADAHAQLEEAARQKQTLIHGVSVLNGGVDAPVNIEIEGRTLIPMQNTVLDPLKYYVLADKKTKVKWADASITAGVAKFTAKAERPTLIRVANFEGKVSVSTLENPHKAFYHTTGATTLQVPSSITSEQSQSGYDQITKLEGTLQGRQNLVNGGISQQLFSFDLIAEVERQLGRIPRTTVADKVQWLKDNLAKLTANWHGLGSGVGGNKATFNAWRGDTSVYYAYPVTHSNGTVTKLVFAMGTPSTFITTDGFIHFLAHAEASDGTTPSTINTDYVELEIELKPEAILHAPRVPLYEVTQAHYDAILVTMLEDEILRRYPSVEGVTHLQNPYIMAEGENLIPSFGEWTTLHANSKVISPYELEVNTPTQYAVNNTVINALPNQTYTFSVENQQTGSYFYGEEYDANNVRIGTSIFSTISQTGKQVKTFTTSANAKTIRIGATNQATSGLFIFKNPMLTVGSVERPFVPRNPSYALFETKLGSISGVADRLYEQDAKYFKRKVVDDLVLDGSLPWSFNSGGSGVKLATIPDANIPGYGDAVFLLTKYNGMLLKRDDNVHTLFTPDAVRTGGGTILFWLSISNVDSGFAESYNPVADEIKAYFNGWKVKTVDGANKPTAWVSIGDGTDAPTQTLDYVKANKAANYTPYKLSYVLATPKVEEIKSEGAISVNGLTQIEVSSGVILREKVTPVLNSGLYLINTYNQSAYLKNRSSKILNVFKNSKNDDLWSKFVGGSTTSNGSGWARLAQSDFDATAEYYVTYLVFDRQPFTANPVNVSAQFANSVRSALEDTTKKVEDNTTAISVNTNILYDVLKRLKAGGL
ncbi:hypothetical protein [Peribacillus asahii]|uniref:hypothetical protein n=1 Tax=Peribacillus asahii TaxID=228899 RepID=UPI003818405C